MPNISSKYDYQLINKIYQIKFRNKIKTLGLTNGLTKCSNIDILVYQHQKFDIPGI